MNAIFIRHFKLKVDAYLNARLAIFDAYVYAHIFMIVSA